LKNTVQLPRFKVLTRYIFSQTAKESTVNGLGNVIRAELYKALRKRRTYLMAGLLWLVVPALLLFIGWILETRVSGSFVEEGVSVQEIVQLIASPVAIARNSLLLLGNLSPSILIIIVALVAALLVGEERTQNMWKTVLTVQPSRAAVLMGKVVTAMILLGVLLLGSYLSGILFGGLGMLFLPTAFGTGWGELAGLYALQWLFGLSATLFAFLMVWLLRSLPLGIVSIFFLPSVIEGAYGFYRAVVGFDRLNRFNAFLEALQLRNTLQELPRYFFTTNLYAPSREPIGALARVFGEEFSEGMSGPFATLFAVDLTRSAAVMAVYALLFGGLLFWSFTRRDIS